MMDSHDARGPGLSADAGGTPSPELVELEWRTIAARLEGPLHRARSARWPLALAAAGAALAVILSVALRREPADAPAPMAGAAFESVEGAELVKLPDGSELRLSHGAAVRVAAWTRSRVELTLERGELTADVPHLEGRSFITAAGAYQVRVIGTRFSVRHDPASGQTSVTVLRGRVEVARADAPDEPRAISAGETWQADPGPRAAAAPPAPPPSPSAEASAAVTAGDPAAAEPPAGSARVEPSAAAGPAADPIPFAPPSWEALAKAKKYREAYDLLGADGFAREVEAAGPEKLFRLAQLARSSGHARDAARAFDALRRRHRGDARAGLAAFELGRMRLDSFGQPAAAAEALADAIALAPGAPFRQDAEARRVQALEASGARAACAAARDAYLARYPSGPQAAVVRGRCAPR